MDLLASRRATKTTIFGPSVTVVPLQVGVVLLTDCERGKSQQNAAAAAAATAVVPAGYLVFLLAVVVNPCQLSTNTQQRFSLLACTW